MEEAKLISQEEAKKIRLEILKELDSFCSANGLSYYLGYGTLIGAIRHKGFIPWDDDCDVWMPRPDLERMEKGYYSDQYELINNRGNNGLIYGFDRLVDKRTYKKVGRFAVEGVNVELYPLDGCPKGSQSIKLYFSVARLFFKCENLLFKYIYGKAIQNRWPFKSLKIKPVKLLLYVFYKFGKHNEYTKSQRIINVFGNPYRYIPYEKKWFGKGKRVLFENTELNVPDNYDAILSQIYGDYMTPPPVDKQVPGHGGDYLWR
ncbi:MAG: LicD family protein [Aeriscardovia sp.]|nr:LicD family protein [Aeriscardovia sp.]